MARYVKLLIDTGYNEWGHNGLLTVAELKVFDNNSINVALGKQVTESSSYTKNHTGIKIVDGKIASYSTADIWATAENTGLSPNGSQWVQIDLGSNYYIKKFELTTRYNSGFGSVTGYRILLSNDGVGWWMVAQITDKPPYPDYRVDEINSLLKSISYLYKKDKTIWGMANGVFGKLADDWDALDEVSRKKLFIDTGYLTPATNDLATLGKFRILVYAMDNGQETITVTALPKDQLVMPRGLISLDSFDGIDKATFTSTIIGNGICKIIVTTDSTSYQTYDFTAQEWKVVDHTDLAAVKSTGINAEKLADIDRAAWDKLIKGKSGIGFAYLMGIDAIADQCAIDQLTLQANMKGTWK